MKLKDGILQKIQKIKERFNYLTEQLSKPEVVSNITEFKKLSKEHSDLEEIASAYDGYMARVEELKQLEELEKTEKDPELKEMVRGEIEELKERLDKDEEEIKVMLLPKDPNENNNVVLEIRAGAGGDEASLFGAELLKMYLHYADKNRWKAEAISQSLTELGGVKEVIYLISGKGAYGKLKYESGVHRVQRVPETESQGRVHTSTVTVAVLPEAEDIEVEIKESDLKVDTFRSGGAGGQHVNKTESAIRITHLPTGIVVECQDERSQIKNREKAMKVLKSRLYDYFQSQAEKEYAEKRRMQVGTGDRSERIRTYNFPQGRVTDHRIGLTLYSLDSFMLGEIDEMITALKLAVQTKLLENSD